MQDGSVGLCQRSGFAIEEFKSRLEVFFGVYGGEDGTIVRWVQDRKVTEKEREYRANVVVEAMSIVCLRGLVENFTHDRSSSLKRIRRSLLALREHVDETRNELADFAIQTISTTIHESKTLLAS